MQPLPKQLRWTNEADVRFKAKPEIHDEALDRGVALETVILTVDGIRARCDGEMLTPLNKPLT